MANHSSFILLAGGAWLALSLTAGCNAVLDIEEAQPRPSADAGGSGSTALVQPLPGGDNYCADTGTNSMACAKCVNDSCAASDQDGCLANFTCRQAMKYYSDCLGSSCNGMAADGSDCSEVNLVNRQGVPTCYWRSCNTQCANSQIYSACQLYCSCLDAECSQNVPPGINADGGTYASLQDCVTDCMTLPVEVVNCRRSHCELADSYKPPTFPHCDHAVGTNACATGSTALAQPRAAASCQKGLNGFACQDKSDCCSGFCAATHLCEEQ